MKSVKLICLLVSVLLLSLSSFKIQAQSNQQQRSDSVFFAIKKYIDQRNTSLIYALGSEGYKKVVNEKNLSAFFEKEIYPLGIIKESSFDGLDKSISKYKLVFESGKLVLSFALDKENRFNSITFTPFKSVIFNKPVPVASSNILKSVLDRQVDSIARQYIQKSNTVGLSIGILNNGVVQTYGYGEIEKGKGKLPDANTIFEIGSITKTFTASILAYYVNAGKISLSDPITKYLPDSLSANPELKKIKIINLSNHTSGLPSLPANFEYGGMDRLNPYKSYNEKMLFASLKTCKLRSVPGEVYAYSNQAVGLLGLILERVSGETYEQLVQHVVTGPLKMSSTCQQLTHLLSGRLVKVYDADGDETRPWDFDALAACGCLRSTVNDLLLYAKANIKCESSSLSNAFGLSHQVTFSKGPVVGLGWHLYQVKDDKYYWHNGGTGGCRSFLIFNIEKKIAVAVISNAEVDVDDVARGILKELRSS